MLIVFNDMIADMGANENLSPKDTELIMRGKKNTTSDLF